MADQSDVEAALVTLAAAALYPAGTSADSACGQPCRIYRGWPHPTSLDADLALGLTQVTVAPVDGTLRNTTRYPDAWASEPPAPTLTVSVVGNVVTFGGTADSRQLAGLAAEGKTFVYRTQANDTPALVAANLAAQARAHFAVLLSGTSITLLDATEIIARVVTDSVSRQEARRQTQRFRLAIWCNDPAVRDTASAVVDLALASTRFTGLADGTRARILFASTTTIDRSENATLYRRDLLYDVEYATTLLAVQPSMLFGTATFNSTDIMG